MPFDVAGQVLKDIEHRRAVGFERYGEYVQVDSEYDMLWEAYYECIDQAIYLRAAIGQRDKERNGR
jgi:hypothetical protein